MVAPMERRFIKERQRDGLEQAKAEGTYKGGKRRLNDTKVLAMYHEGKGPTAIAKATGCSRMQVYCIISRTAKG
jgi:DNA invertase Pin-like site-specific DNA recombinase